MAQRSVALFEATEVTERIVSASFEGFSKLFSCNLRFSMHRKALAVAEAWPF